MAHHEKTERQIDFYNRFGSPLQWLGAITIGLTTGAVTFYNLIHNKFHRDLSEDFGLLQRYRAGEIPNGTSIQSIIKDHFEKYEPEFLQKYSKTTDKAQFLTRVRSPEFVTEAKKTLDMISEGKGKFRHFTKLFAEHVLDIRSFSWKGLTVGTWQRLKTFSPTSRFNTVFKGLFAIGAGTGITLMAFNQLNTRDKLNELTKTTSDTNVKLDTLLSQHDEHHREFREYRSGAHHGSKAEAVLAERAETDAALGDEGHAL